MARDDINHPDTEKPVPATSERPAAAPKILAADTADLAAEGPEGAAAIAQAAGDVGEEALPDAGAPARGHAARGRHQIAQMKRDPATIRRFFESG